MTGNDSSVAPDEPKTPEAEAEEKPDPLIGLVLAGRYRLDERLGVGGMGVVYRAEHVLMRKSVAVKVLHRELTALPEIVKRFEREAIAAGRIEHPNVTLATDFGKLEDGSFYLVLEFVPGRSLSQALREDGAFPVERALFVARQIAAALVAAHGADIVHRDLKPDNVMLIERGGTKDFVKVLDFGIAKLSDESAANGPITRLGSVFGTPQYMAPEQAAGKTVDARADLYALGLVLYELLAGKPAFDSKEIVGLLTKQLIEAPPPLPSTVDAEVSAIVTKLVEKDPNDRFQTATEVVAALDARLGPVIFAPDSTMLGVPSVKGPPPSTAFAPTAALDVVPAALAETPAPAIDAIRTGTFAFIRKVARGDSVKVAGKDVSARLLAAVAAMVVLGIPIATSVGAPSVPSVASAAAPVAPPPPPEIAQTLASARAGERPAIAELESRPASKRTAAEWEAIGIGHSRLGEPMLALPALEQAARLDPAIGDNHGVLLAVRSAVDDDQTRSEAMNFAANSLGAGGADLLFDVYTGTAEKTDTTALAKSLLARDDVRSHASKPLALALDLRKLTRCDEVKKLLPEVTASGDDRSSRPLTSFASRKGCGFLGLGDCFSCLRRGAELADAQRAVAQRKSPTF